MQIQGTPASILPWSKELASDMDMDRWAKEQKAKGRDWHFERSEGLKNS
jgi:hypothetical protein